MFAQGSFFKFFLDQVPLFEPAYDFEPPNDPFEAVFPSDFAPQFSQDMRAGDKMLKIFQNPF